MKEITITIDDDVFTELERAIFVKTIAGKDGGVIDEFVKKTIQAIKENNKNKHFSFKT